MMRARTVYTLLMAVCILLNVQPALVNNQGHHLKGNQKHMMNLDPANPGRATILQLITDKKSELREAMLIEPRMRHNLWTAEQTLKQIEDEIAREIWQRADLKNDRDRNASKHLARINDQRF